MKTIWKVQLAIVGEQTVRLPDGSSFVSVQYQDGIPTAWAEVELNGQLRNYEIRVIGTGHSFDGTDLNHIGTLQDKTVGLVWHVFVKRSPA